MGKGLPILGLPRACKAYYFDIIDDVEYIRPVSTKLYNEITSNKCATYIYERGFCFKVTSRILIPLNQ